MRSYVLASPTPLRRGDAPETNTTTMAIFHCSVKPISRSTGRSAPAAAAYRSGDELVNERDGLVHDYTNRRGVDHAEIVLPSDRGYEWATDRSVLWNAAEKAENRIDSRVAREIVIALPHELNAQQRLYLTRDYAQSLADRYGVAVDFAIHQPSTNGDERNVHAHLMMTTRQIEKDGLGAKSQFEMQDKVLRAQGLPSGRQQVIETRRLWEERANEHLREAGFDVCIDHRSHHERGLSIEPTQHMGHSATAMQRDGKDIDKQRISEEAAQRNAERIIERPESVLEVITSQQSVFTHRDVARAVDRYVPADRFQEVYAKVMASPELVKLADEKVLEGGGVEAAKYSTQAIKDLEAGMARAVDRLRDSRGYAVSPSHVQEAMQRGNIRLSDEQAMAVRHLTGDERIAVVRGFAGAGKSTMLDAAREAWEREGYRVRGASLGAVAVDNLKGSSGIEDSRTLASWQTSWQHDVNRLERGDVLVIDEAGMVSSVQLAAVVREAEAQGAKVVLVGDDQQLQPIGPGASFAAVIERTGAYELSEVRRQKEEWQREASRQFGKQETQSALEAYDRSGHIHMHRTSQEATQAIMRAYVKDMDDRPDGSRLVLTHRNADVQALNEAIRATYKERGELGGGQEYTTENGVREFAPGDRVLFRENNRDMGVFNGTLGTVERVESGRLTVRLDSDKGIGGGAAVEVDTALYRNFDHGYAMTVHKAQGVTVDRAFVQASPTMDSHLAYVSMTRHRDQVDMHASVEDFAGRRGGVLVEHGQAAFEHREGEKPSYYVTLENHQGERHTTWGVDLERAMQASGAQVGDRIGLQHEGSTPVTLPTGEQVERNQWRVLSEQDMAKERMYEALSRVQTKETTLDYADAYEGHRPHDPIVVDRQVQQEVQRQAERQQQPTLHETAPAAHIEAAADPQAQRSQALAQTLRGLDDDRLLVELHRGVIPPHERARAVENDPKVKEAAQVLATVRQRDTIERQHGQAVQKLEQLESKGFLGRIGSGAEREATRAQVQGLRQQLDQVQKRLPDAGMTEQQAERALSSARSEAMKRSAWQSEYTVAERQAAVRAELERRAPGAELGKLANDYQKAQRYGLGEPERMRGLSNEQRERVIAYAQAKPEERAQMRERENALGQQPGGRAIQPPEQQKQMGRELQRGGYER